MAYTTTTFFLKKMWSERHYSAAMLCATKDDLREALVVAQADKKRATIMLDAGLSSEFIAWGRRYKAACRRFKLGKYGFFVKLLMRKPFAAAKDIAAAYSEDKSATRIAEEEPLFADCIVYDYYPLPDGRTFVKFDSLSLVGGAAFMGKRPLPFHFKF